MFLGKFFQAGLFLQTKNGKMGLSEYEKLREANLRQNRKILADLGLLGDVSRRFLYIFICLSLLTPKHR